jgi:flagellar assembly protein FliH
MSEPRRPAGTPSHAAINAGLARVAANASVERWSMPDVRGPLIGRARDDKKKGDDSVELLRQALQESEARGYQAGLERAQAESQVSLEALAAKVRQLESILEFLAKPLADLDEAVEKELLQLALTVGKQLARRELRVDPAQVIGIIRESLSQLPASARDIRIHLHPDDAATVRERLAEPTSQRAWNIVEDPTLTRGGCVVRTEASQIDVKFESRVSAVIASALGDERAPERPVEQQAATGEPT